MARLDRSTQSDHRIHGLLGLRQQLEVSVESRWHTGMTLVNSLVETQREVMMCNTTIFTANFNAHIYRSDRYLSQVLED